MNGILSQDNSLPRYENRVVGAFDSQVCSDEDDLTKDIDEILGNPLTRPKITLSKVQPSFQKPGIRALSN
jgi:hypothetical protein